MPLRFLKISDHISIERTLSGAEDREVRAALALMRSFLDLHGPYAAMTFNYNEIDQHLRECEESFVNERRAFRSAQSIDIMMLQANRLLMNLFSSARSYLDIMAHNLREQLSEREARYHAWRSLMYDEAFAYRLCENLRNVAQHSQLPLRALSAHRERQPDGSFSATQELKIDRAAFLRSPRIQAAVRGEVESMSGNIPIRPYLQEYFERLGTIHLMVLREVVEPYFNAAICLGELISEIGDPTVSAPG